MEITELVQLQVMGPLHSPEQGQCPRINLPDLCRKTYYLKIEIRITKTPENSKIPKQDTWVQDLPAWPTMIFLHSKLVKGSYIGTACHAFNYKSESWETTCPVDTTERTEHPVTHAVDHVLKDPTAGTLGPVHIFKSLGSAYSVSLAFSFPPAWACSLWSYLHPLKFIKLRCLFLTILCYIHFFVCCTQKPGNLSMDPIIHGIKETLHILQE